LPELDCFYSADSEKKEIKPRKFDWLKAHVAVYSTPAPPDPEPSLRDLGDHGQAQAISFLEKDSRLKGGAWATLRGALDGSKPEAGERDPFRFDRVLIANVAKGIDWNPGDRMIWTRILVQPINFSFAGYSVARTDNQTQKMASVERTDSRKFSAELSATIPGMEGPKAGLGPSSEHTVKTNSDINAQYEKLGIDIMPSFLRIMRESETGGDAVGNTKVSLTVVTNPEMIRKRSPTDQRSSDDDPYVLLVTGTHFDEDGADRQSAGKKKKPAIDVLPQVPVPHCALRARVWMLYEQRKVDRGHEFYEEGKQSVRLVRDAEDKQDVEIMGADEVSPAVWSLRLCKDPQCTGEGTSEDVLRAKVQPGLAGAQNAWRKVVFTDYGVAIRLAYWLKRHETGRLPNPSYKINYPNYTGGTYATLKPAKINGDECKAEAPITASSIRAYSKRVAARRLRGRRFADADR
jgi:hypothetical protein